MSLKDDLWRILFLKRRVDDESTVRRHFRDEHDVQIGNRKARVNTEACSGDLDFTIYTSSVREWLPPHDQESFTETDKAIVLEKLRRYFDQNRYKYELR